MKKIVLALFIISQLVCGQTYRYVKSIASFSEATSFSINPAGFIYVADRVTNMVYKLDTLGNQLISTGGYGWQNGSFDEPVDVFSNTLTVFVSDKNNHRIQQFDKDLNYVSQLFKHNSKNQDARFGYPVGCAVSNLGDLYVLETENKRVLKFDLFGNFVMQFGGFNDAKYGLSNPRKIGVAPDNRIYVLNGNQIYTFDNFGNGLKKMELGAETSMFNTFGNYILLFYGRDLILGNLLSGSTKKLDIGFAEDYNYSNIVSFVIFNDILYLLTKTEIQVYAVAG